MTNVDDLSGATRISSDSQDRAAADIKRHCDSIGTRGALFRMVDRVADFGSVVGVREMKQINEPFYGIKGLTLVDPKDLEEYEQAMREAIPEIIEDVRRRRQIAMDTRHMVIQ